MNPECTLCKAGWPIHIDKDGGKFHIDIVGNFDETVNYEFGSIAPCPLPERNDDES